MRSAIGRIYEAMCQGWRRAWMDSKFMSGELGEEIVRDVV
jgi:hypothetical protein